MRLLLFFLVFSLSLFFRGGGAVFHLHGIRVMPLGNLWLLPSGLLIFFFHLLFSFLPSPLSGASAPALRALLHKFARPTKSVTVWTLRVPYDSAESSGLNQTFDTNRVWAQLGNCHVQVCELTWTRPILLPVFRLLLGMVYQNDLHPWYLYILTWNCFLLQY